MKYKYPSWRLALSLPWVACLARAQNNGTDPVNNMCMRWAHQSVVKNDVLYIYGGLMYFVSPPNATTAQEKDRVAGYNFDLIQIDMSKSWDWMSNISETALAVQPDPQTGRIPPQLEYGWLYQGTADSSEIFLYGGEIDDFNTAFPGYGSPFMAQYSLWSYDTAAGGSWDQHDLTDTITLQPSNGFAAEAPDQDLAFYLNGKVNAESNPSNATIGVGLDYYIGGMIVIHTNDGTAQNVSSAGFSGSSPRIGGSMVYIPNVGRHGILVAFGGAYNDAWDPVVTPSQNYTFITYPPYFANLDTIYIYDIDSLYSSNSSDGWYTQTATGAIPGARINFCAVVISTEDNSTHNIYAYGGQGPTNTSYDDVHVLSLPSFTWTQVYGPGPSARWSHTCHVVGRSQMLTVGGRLNSVCDWEHRGVAIFNMTDSTWGSVFDAHDAPYVLPSAVQQTISGNNTANPFFTAPVNGWSSLELATLFSESPSHHKSRVPAIIGGVVGGVGGALLLAGLAGWAIWWRRRSRKRRLADAKAKRESSDGREESVEAAGVERLELDIEGARQELPGVEGEDLRNELEGTAIVELPGPGLEGEWVGRKRSEEKEERRAVEMPA